MNITQRSLSGGELSPSLYQRVDTVKYQTGLRTMRNTITRGDGGSQNRPGTEFCAPCIDSVFKSKLIPFDYGDDTYILEFSEERMRVHLNGAPVVKIAAGLETTIVSITQAAEAEITVNNQTSDALDEGVFVILDSIEGMSELNGRVFELMDKVDNTFKIRHNGEYVDTTAFQAYVSGGNISELVEIDTPYLNDELFELQVVQRSNELVIAHGNHLPHRLICNSPTDWELSEHFNSDETLDAPTDLAFTQGANGTVTASYTVTAINKETGKESRPGYVDTAGTILGITKGNPTQVVFNEAAAGMGFNGGGGNLVLFRDVDDFPELNGYHNVITSGEGGGHYYIYIDLDSTGFDNWEDTNLPTSSGIFSSCATLDTTTAAPTSAAPNVIAWDEPDTGTPAGYNIYKSSNGVMGFIGTTTNLTFNDTGFTPDLTITPPYDAEANFEYPDFYPAVVSAIQQRLTFGNLASNVERVLMSRTGDHLNFTKNLPLQDDSSIDFIMIGQKINDIRHIVDIGQMLIFTSRGEWAAGGGTGDVITPTDINLKQHSYNGASKVPPIVLSGKALYIQERGSIVRDFSFDFQIDGYRGNDLTTFAKHLFKGKTIVAWAYQQNPNSIVWAVRDDGVVLAMTYVLEQQILAWNHHDFEGGVVEDVISVPEGLEDKVYFVIKRGDNRYIERLATRDFDDIVDAKFMDSNLTYDGRNDTDITMAISGGTSYLNTETLTITASEDFFTADDVGNEIHIDLYDEDEDSDTYGEILDTIRFTLKAYTSPTVMTGKSHKTVSVAMRAAKTTWSKAVDEVSGLFHLEGEDVTVFADGYVVANPHNAQKDIITVENARCTLPNCYSVIHVGLPVTADIETLDIDTPDAQSVVDQDKNVQAVTLYLEDTRGGWVGPRQPPDEASDYVGGMIEFKPRALEPYTQPDLKNGPHELHIPSEWNSHGRIFIRQTDPLPISVLGIVVSGIY